jgi:hypothetical protein
MTEGYQGQSPWIVSGARIRPGRRQLAGLSAGSPSPQLPPEAEAAVERAIRDSDRTAARLAADPAGDRGALMGAAVRFRRYWTKP